MLFYSAADAEASVCKAACCTRTAEVLELQKQFVPVEEPEI